MYSVLLDSSFFYPFIPLPPLNREAIPLILIFCLAGLIYDFVSVSLQKTKSAFFQAACHYNSNN